MGSARIDTMLYNGFIIERSLPGLFQTLNTVQTYRAEFTNSVNLVASN